MTGINLQIDPTLMPEAHAYFSKHPITEERMKRIMSGDVKTAIHRGIWDRISGAFRGENKTAALKQLLNWASQFEVKTHLASDSLKLSPSLTKVEKSTPLPAVLPLHTKFSQLQNFEALKALAIPNQRQYFEQRVTLTPYWSCTYSIHGHQICEEHLPEMLENLEVGSATPLFVNFFNRLAKYFIDNQKAINQELTQKGKKEITPGRMAGEDESVHITRHYLAHAPEIQPLLAQLLMLNLSLDQLFDAFDHWKTLDKFAREGINFGRFATALELLHKSQENPAKVNEFEAQAVLTLQTLSRTAKAQSLAEKERCYQEFQTLRKQSAKDSTNKLYA